MLLLDLGVFHRKSHAVSLKESLIWVAVWVSLALVFGVLVYYEFGKAKALEYLAGYVVELSLSVDNLFVFILIFSYFSVPAKYQHRILFWGIIGALLLRFIFILAGAALLSKFHWLIYVFGFVLVYSGVKMISSKDKEMDPEKNYIVRFFRRMMPVTDSFRGNNFFIRESGRLFATPLFIVLIVVETTDVIFAVDSVPAILAITRDTFIVYTSNAFAILGLRSLYFSLAGLMNLFRYLHYGLSLILVFIGVKMMIVEWYKIPIEMALTVVVSILFLSIILSLLIKKENSHEEEKNTGNN